MEMEKQPHWRFPLNDGGERRGINAGYDAKFRSERLKSLAREICQNSLDARLNDQAPVHVEFHRFTISKEEFPDYENYHKFLEECLNYWENKNPNGRGRKSNEVMFLTRAVECINQEKIPVLRISDHHTTGSRLNVSEWNKETGEEEIRNEWEGLTRSSGIQFKAAGASGSYGIGKAAAFACSDLMTVFYSTANVAGQHLSKGVAHFATFVDGEGKERQNTGYCCNVNGDSSQDDSICVEKYLDRNFHRADGDYGTDIYVLGFHDEGQSDWGPQLLEAVVTDFIYAVQNNLLEVTVDGIHLAKDNLKTFIDASAVEAIGKDTEWIEQASLYYDILTEDSEHVHRTELPIEEGGEEIGKLRLSVLTDRSECSKYVMMTRQNGMKICEWGPRQKFPKFPFEGICYADGLKLNERLRSMETPEHTAWKEGTSGERGMKTKDEKLLREMREKIREYLKEIMKQAPGSNVDAIGAAALLPEDFLLKSESEARGGNSDSAPTESGQIVVLKRKRDQSIMPDGATDDDIESQAGESADEGDAEGFSSGEEESDAGMPQNGNETAGETGSGSSSPKGTEDYVDESKHGEKSRKREKHVGLSNFRYVPSQEEHTYRMMLSPKRSAKHLHLQVFLSAETEKIDAPIRSAVMNGRQLIVCGNEISGFSVEHGRNYRLDVQFDVDDDCSVEVSAYETEA